MKQTRSLSKFSCLSEYTRLYPFHFSCNEDVNSSMIGSIGHFKEAGDNGEYPHYWTLETKDFPAFRLVNQAPVWFFATADFCREETGLCLDVSISLFSMRRSIWVEAIRESPPQFENPIMNWVYVRSITHSTMYRKAPLC